ncbi:MAG: 4Fe-4S binding protein [Parcubacteria group bacterium]|jgi:NapH/MauN family ferredoxin-type protein
MKNIFSPRRVSQIIIVGIVFFLTIGHLRYGIEKAAPIDAYCPFGAFEGLLTYVTTGEYLQRIYASSFILMGIVLILTLLFGRVFCSHLCPLGALQEWIRALGKKIGFKKDVELPKSVDKYARYIKYIILLVIIYFSYKTGELIFRGYDPFNALMHLGEEFDEKVVGYLILVVLLIASLFSKNWWCRYFCPLGAGLGILKKISPFKIKRNETTCVSCGICDEVCPANLNIGNAKEVNSADCISCLNCIKDCPQSSLKATTMGKEISKKSFSWIIMIAFFVMLGLVMLTPIWKTKVPSNLIGDNGELNISNLRGSNTLEYLLDTTKIPLSVFQEKLNLPQGVDKKTKLKDIGTKYDIKKADGSFIEMEDFKTVVEEFSNQKIK